MITHNFALNTGSTLVVDVLTPKTFRLRLDASGRFQPGEVARGEAGHRNAAVGLQQGIAG